MKSKTIKNSGSKKKFAIIIVNQHDTTFKNKLINNSLTIEMSDALARYGKKN